MATYRSLAQFDPNSGAQTTFDSLGGLEDLARQLGWQGQWQNGVFDPTASNDPMEWLKQQGFDLTRTDGLTGPNGRMATEVGATRNGQQASYTNEARPEQSVGGLFGDILKDFVLPSAAMYFGGNALTGGGGLPATGGASAASSAPALTGSGAAMTGGGMTFDSALPMLGQATVPQLATQTSRLLGGASGGMGLGQLAGGLLGAATSRGGTSTQTKTSEPWGPAQDWLKSLIGQGQQLSDQYAAQPFSDTQKQALGNVFGLLNSANTAAPGMMQQIGALGRGYDRNAANRTQTGYTPQQFDLSGLLKMIPTFGGRNG